MERYSATVSARVAEEAALARHQQEEARRRHAEVGARGSTEALEQYCSVGGCGLIGRDVGCCFLAEVGVSTEGLEQYCSLRSSRHYTHVSMCSCC